jgi:hypothetical protein
LSGWRQQSMTTRLTINHTSTSLTVLAITANQYTLAAEGSGHLNETLTKPMAVNTATAVTKRNTMRCCVIDFT